MPRPAATPLSDVVCSHPSCDKLCPVKAVEGETTPYCSRACFALANGYADPVTTRPCIRSRCENILQLEPGARRDYCSENCKKLVYQSKDVRRDALAPVEADVEPTEADLQEVTA